MFLSEPLGLTMRPAARIVRELPPSLTAYRVELSFRAATLGALAVVRSTADARTNEKALAAASGRTPQELPGADA